MKKISGWGNYPIQYAEIVEPKNKEELKDIIKKENNLLARGLGRSYGDAANNENNKVILLTHFKEMKLDENGVLTVGAGASLEEIIAYTLPKGYFLPTTPGTKFVTVGGAIAHDVHGKNHHIDGGFSEFVLSFQLLIANGNIIMCSRDENKDIFYATVGGIGLTGVILSATIQMTKVESAYINAYYEKAENIHEAIDKFTKSDNLYQFSVAWIDCMSNGAKTGRSVLMRGNYAKVSELPEKRKNEPYKIKEKMKLNVPFYLPSFLLNNTTIKLFNSFYYRIHKNAQKITDYDSFFYPLDSIHHWNRGYGKRGFLQYQMVLPFEKGKEGLLKALDFLQKEKQISFLAVLKTSGKESGGLLSFPKEGYTLALDLPIRKNTFEITDKLDEIVLEYGGRIYLAKDARMKPEVFQRMYGDNIQEFKEIKNKIDPNGVFSSSMARRLHLL